MKKPNSLRHLDDAIRRQSGGAAQQYVEMRTMLANAIVAQMLPDGVIKGGTSLKMRFGDAASRFTTDLDTATAMNPEAYAERVGTALAVGWEGFTGRVVAREPATPEGVPEEYLMHPFDVKLSYLGKPWCTVPLEVGFNEIGDADVQDWVYLEEVERLFENLGFPSLGKVPLMPLRFQIAQKIHGLTGRGNRGRDLIDLQIIMGNAQGLDFSEIKETCIRLFKYRKQQTWPPVVEKREGWDASYMEQSVGLSVIDGVDEAVLWARELVERIDQA